MHQPSTQERSLAEKVVNRFQENGVPLSFAGIDFLYHQNEPVISEVEDVVGSRMLYHVSNINIVGLFLDGVRRAFAHG